MWTSCSLSTTHDNDFTLLGWAACDDSRRRESARAELGTGNRLAQPARVPVVSWLLMASCRCPASAVSH